MLALLIPVTWTAHIPRLRSALQCCLAHHGRLRVRGVGRHLERDLLFEFKGRVQNSGVDLGAEEEGVRKKGKKKSKDYPNRKRGFVFNKKRTKKTERIS